MWDLTASACSCELVPEIGTPVRSLTVALDGTMIVAANNNGTCYVWRMMRGRRRCPRERACNVGSSLAGHGHAGGASAQGVL